MKYILFILIIAFTTSCSSFKEVCNVNSPKDGLKLNYNLKKGKLDTKYKINKIITLKY